MASTKQSVLRRSWVAHVGDSDWRLAFGYAVPVVGFVLGLFYQWFALANRCVIFLYGHMRARPFDRRTISRYWMAGLVASGMVMVLYAFWNWLLGRVASWHEVFDYHPSEWWRVWLICALSVAVGILVITTTVNQPTLPADVAVWCVLATLIGLALALAPGAWAAERPRELLWLAGAGAGLVPLLLLLRVVEIPAGELPGGARSYALALGSIAVGVIWSILLGRWYTRKYRSIWRTDHLVVSGLGWSYLLLPLAHYFFFTPPSYRYITSAGNFFASSLLVQLVAFLTAGAFSSLVTALQTNWLLR